MSIDSERLRHADVEARTTYGIEPLQLMEVAGWQIAHFLDAFFNGVAAKSVLVVAGSGNNGGDALVAARVLRQRGATVRVSIVRSAQASTLAARHAATAARIGIPIAEAPAGIDARVDLILDGLLGTGIRPPLRPAASAIIAAMNAAKRPIVAIDVPSGMDADTGAGADHAVDAAATLTLAAPKAGLMTARNSGRVFLADIGMPLSLFGADAPALEALYRLGPLVELIAR